MATSVATADDQTLGVDHDPLLLHLGGFCRKVFM
jgi:hypothetical protein